MKLKKFFVGICAAAVSATILTLSAGAVSTSYDGYAGDVPVRCSLSVTNQQAVATASICDNPANYRIAQAQVLLLDYTMVSDLNDEVINNTTNTKWGTGGAGCQALAIDGYSITDATSYNQYNINGIIYGGARYKLTAKV